jgi:hypothetical protein
MGRKGSKKMTSPHRSGHFFPAARAQAECCRPQGERLSSHLAAGSLA